MENINELIKYAMDELKDEVTDRLTNKKIQIEQSIDYVIDTYDIFGTIIHKDDIKIFEDYFVPVLQNELKPKDIKHLLVDEKKIVAKIFLEETYDVLKYMENVTFNGKLKNNENEYMCELKFEIDVTYKDAIKQLFHTTRKNKIKWKPINIPYATKFLNIVVVDYDRNALKEEALEISYDLTVFDMHYKTDYLLCWNIKEGMIDHIEEYIKPTYYQITYEYLLPLNANKKYLMQISHGELMVIYKETPELLRFILDEKLSEKCLVYEVLPEIDIDTKEFLEYPYYGNSVSKQIKLKHIFKIEQIQEMLSHLAFIDGLSLKGINDQYFDTENLFDDIYFIQDEFEMKKKKEIIYLNFLHHQTYVSKEIEQYICSVLNTYSKEFQFKVGEV